MNSSWRLQGGLHWALTLLGFAFASVLAVALIYMIHRVDFDGIGVLGLYAFLVPSQLLIVCVLTAIAALVFWRRQWRWPSFAFASIALCAFPMSLCPTLSLYVMARQNNVNVSLVQSLIPSITLGGIQLD